MNLNVPQQLGEVGEAVARIDERTTNTNALVKEMRDQLRDLTNTVITGQASVQQRIAILEKSQETTEKLELPKRVTEMEGSIRFIKGALTILATAAGAGGTGVVAWLKAAGIIQ